MHRPAIIGALIAFVVLLPVDVQGCGDKFFVPGRGVRFPSRSVNREAAAVLFFARSGSALNRTITNLSIDARLRTAGYRPVFVTSDAAFESVLRSAVWDVVVVDFADAADVHSRLPATHATVVLPVVSDPQEAALTRADRAHAQVLKSPKRDRAFVEALDKVIAARAKARSKTRGA